MVRALRTQRDRQVSMSARSSKARGQPICRWCNRPSSKGQVGAMPTVTLNARVCETYPEVVEACVENSWELNAHSYDQIPMHKLERSARRHHEINGHHRKILG